ncbi:MAG: sulfatase-like hydrolase/transferase [Bacteroides sp.]|nr:sulfatase-like hydrolase/transferase [Roseburia sp.]MCM1345816.1 sulfatase-like hydrolase/transferase [Bacteroides sp.]MCM1421281.1 sulfatase-like hydrolase/transferase [Bacteroides sp.]
MKKNIIGIITYYALVASIFLVIQKPLFILYNSAFWTTDCSMGDLPEIYLHGFALDNAVAGYITIIPLILLWISIYSKEFKMSKWMNIYNWLIAFLIAIVTMTDTVLYEFWEFKLDSTIFFYLNDPKNAFTSVSTGFIAIRLLTVLLLTALFYVVLRLPMPLLAKREWKKCPQWYIKSGMMLCLAGCLFVSIRGLRKWPNTASRAYYSRTDFCNHSALNPLYNLLYTMTKTAGRSDEFKFLAEEECAREFEALFPVQKTSRTSQSQTQPNILVIIMEGFSATFIESLGGMPEVAPGMSQLMDEGICFTQCYCSSFRTDRGLPAAISGYIAQPTTSVIKMTRKLHSLPGLPKTLKAYGYDTSVLYGGDITFFAMSDFFLATGHDKLISQDDFPAKEATQNWGVPDHITCEWLKQDIIRKHQSDSKPWYMTYLTLSSHTPFDVPYHRLQDERLNAFAYTDSCVSTLINDLKQTEAWKNLLVVCIADHGFNQSAECRTNTKDYAHIPFLITGGTVREARKINYLVSQTDLPATILGLLGLPHDEFRFSRDVLSESYTYPFAFNSYNNGFMFRDSTGCIIYDNNSKLAIEGADSARERKGKVILQTVYDDLQNYSRTAHPKNAR